MRAFKADYSAGVLPPRLRLRTLHPSAAAPTPLLLLPTMTKKKKEKSISTFPTALLTLTKLESLEVSCPKLIGPIPAHIAKLVNLQRLVMERCSFDSIPFEICQLQALAYLGFRGDMGDCLSKTATWRALSRMPTLKQLDVSNCGLQRLPVLGKNDEDDVLERGCCFRNLVALDISGNVFGLLPSDDQLAGLSDMHALSSLTMRSCLLSDLPEHCCNLERMSYLDVSNNLLVDLPDFVSRLDRLTHFVAVNNLFPALPAAALKGSQSLEVLDFSECTYLEVSSAVVEEMVHALPRLKRINVKKAEGVPFQASSKQWIKQAEQSVRGEKYRRDVEFTY